jgi:hypothetical protein
VLTSLATAQQPRDRHAGADSSIPKRARPPQVVTTTVLFVQRLPAARVDGDRLPRFAPLSGCGRLRNPRGAGVDAPRV